MTVISIKFGVAVMCFITFSSKKRFWSMLLAHRSLIGMSFFFTTNVFISAASSCNDGYILLLPSHTAINNKYY
jgi:hypothetical protein